ncbi:unnamed protein product [Dicrocoelium dendriticum]|nr:unnamed protein product [Dicrocoelium dendriticum]
MHNLNYIILAGIPSNTDMATSEDQKLVKAVDPVGLCTPCILPTLNPLGQGTEAHDLNLSLVVPPYLGMIGGLNRLQADIKSSELIEQALQDKANFLYRWCLSLASQTGTPHFARTSNVHIRESLLEVKTRGNVLAAQFQN